MLLFRLFFVDVSFFLALTLTTLLPRIRVHAPVHVAANFWEPDHVLRVQVHFMYLIIRG